MLTSGKIAKMPDFIFCLFRNFKYASCFIFLKLYNCFEVKRAFNFESLNVNAYEVFYKTTFIKHMRKYFNDKANKSVVYLI